MPPETFSGLILKQCPQGAFAAGLHLGPRWGAHSAPRPVAGLGEKGNGKEGAERSGEERRGA